MMTDKQVHLLDGLENLLERQIQLVQQGNISGVTTLSEQADSLVQEMAQAGILELTEFENRRERLQKLYERVNLALAAEKADTAARLSRVRKGKKLLGTYASSFRNKA
jgi:hypothetical protein